MFIFGALINSGNMHRARTYRTEAVILRRLEYGEADRILTLFTPDLGKLRVLAKGIRRPASRKAGHLELFTRTDLFLARGREMDLVTQAATLEAFRPLREDLYRTSCASYAVELLDKFTQDQDDNRPLYELLVSILGWLGESPDPALSLRYYELQLLALVGYRPELQRCVRRREPIRAEDQFFSAAGGGVICPTCGPETPAALPISVAALKMLRHLQRTSYAEATAARVRPLVQAELERVTQHYITYLLERRLKSVEFLRLVRHGANAE